MLPSYAAGIEVVTTGISYKRDITLFPILKLI